LTFAKRLAARLGPLWLVPFLFALVLAACAQSPDTGAIEGSILDPIGRPVSGALLSATDPATGATRSTTSDIHGAFRFSALAATTYVVAISAPDLAGWQGSALVQVGTITPLEATLTLPGILEGVEVVDTAATPVLDTSDATLATILDKDAVDNLPSSGRRWSNFALLTPGVTPDASADGLLSFRGIGTLLNNNTLDGADNNQAFLSQERGTTLVAYSTSQAAVSEFQVNVSNYSAQYGRAAGGVINTVTQSGTNTIHGELFAFDRNNGWAASNPFTTITTYAPATGFTSANVKPQDTLVQGGVAIGGPILHDKLFGFFTYDDYSRDFPGIARAYDPRKFFAPPTQQDLLLLASRLLTSPAAALSGYNNVLSGLNSLLGSARRTANQTIYFPKLDYQLNERNHFTLQYNRMRWNSPNGVQTSPSATYGLASFGTSLVKDDSIIARWAMFLTPNLLNEAHFQYGRDFESELSDPPAPFEQPLAQNIYGRAPQVQVSSYGFRFGTPPVLNRASFPDERRDELTDTLTWVHGRHTLKTGYEVNYVNDYSDSLYNGNGTYTYSTVLNFVTDYLAPDTCDASSAAVGVLPCYSTYTQGIGPTTFQFQSIDYAGFVSDEWKPFGRLTLSLGLRYEYEQLPNTNRALSNPDIPQTASLPHDKNNYGPRMGLALDLSGSGTTILRAGVGTYYGRIINSTALSALTETGSSNSQRSYYYKPLDLGAPPFPYVFSSTPVLTVAPSAVYFDAHFQNPQIYQTELSVEQQIGSHTNLTLAYMGSYGRELPNYVDRNIDLANIGTITYQVVDPNHLGPLPSTYTTKFFTTRLNPNYQQITDIVSETNSQYQAAVLRLDHQASRSIDLHASFTHAHAIDANQNATAFADTDDVLDPTDLALEHGNSNFDIRNRLTGGLVLRAPWHYRGLRGALLDGYLLAPTGELRDGLPYSMATAGSVPSTKYVDTVDRTETLSGLGASINGSGGATRLPTVGRNTFRYPGVANMDLRVAKRTHIDERFELELAVESFNLLNHQNVTAIDTTGYLVTGASSLYTPPKLTWQDGGTTGTGSEFGTVTNANNTNLYRDRQIQLAARLHF
jgi:outer membrane receptor protein involved in Fe transport